MAFSRALSCAAGFYDMGSALLIENGTIITPDAAGHRWERGWVLCVDGSIARMGQGDSPNFSDFSPDVIDANGMIVHPGMIDLHVHGGGGDEVMDATPDALRRLSIFYASHGVTAFLATTWTDTPTRIANALRNVHAMMDHPLGGAEMLGVHLEGPFLNVEKIGAQNPEFCRAATREEAIPYLDLNVIRLLALAPEITANQWLIRECVQRGITVSAAHTSATYADMQHAIAMGVSQTTHTFNAMTPLNHREPGVVGAAMTSPDLACELICDGIHVHPAAMHALYRAKGTQGIIIITDAVRAAGMPNGEYPIDDRTIYVRDGAVRLADGTLAGSAATMEKCYANFIHATGTSVTTAWQASSFNAARAIGAASHKGSIERGKDADLVLFSQSLMVEHTIVAGRVVYSRA
jgi:N-acetylglucosamine-6-phosphate deacetylase